MAADVAAVLNSSLAKGTQRAVLSDVCWTWTELDGKYAGCTRWTEMAVMSKIADPRAKLIHEHIVPRREMLDILFSLSTPSPDVVQTLLERLLIAVVVTPEQDELLNCDHRSRMPKEFSDRTHADFHEPWLRYRPYLSMPGFRIINPPADFIKEMRSRIKRRR